MYKKIDIALNGEYICSTCNFKTCKAAINDLKTRGFIEFAGVGYSKSGCRIMDKIIINPTDKITAHFAK